MTLAFITKLFWLFLVTLGLAAGLEFYYMTVKLKLLGGLLKEHRSAKTAWDRFCQQNFKSHFSFSHQRQNLEILKRHYDALSNEREKSVQQLQNSHLSMHAKLKGRQIACSGIEGLKPAILRQLKKKRIETAADLTEGGLRAAELEEAMVKQLLQWRRRCEKEVFNEASAQVLQTLDREIGPD